MGVFAMGVLAMGVFAIGVFAAGLFAAAFFAAGLFGATFFAAAFASARRAAMALGLHFVSSSGPLPLASSATNAAIFFARPAGVFTWCVRNASA